jgi:hypothetical protein
LFSAALVRRAVVKVNDAADSTTLACRDDAFVLDDVEVTRPR